MEAIRVSIDVNIKLTQATQQFIATLFNHTVPTPITAPAIMATATAKTQATTQAAPAPEVEATKEEGTQEEAITVEMLRALVSANANDHRDEMKAKLNEFEAKSVTVLDKKHYPAMYSFLKSLK